ncbi:MAG: hypothetical protein ACQZ2J_01820 [Pseudomonas piscis]|uniref:hypothetical protein n=1 Tax=Pseudomonas piscis TaxID=2614538 RepID=UPI003D29EBAA
MDANNKDDIQIALNTPQEPQKLVEAKWPWILAILMFIACTSIYTLNFSFGPTSWTAERFGTLGDFIGGIINPAVSTLALYFLVKAYYIQKIELTETRTALRESAEHQQKLAETALAQSRLDEKSLRVNILMVQVNSYQTQITIIQSELARVTDLFNNSLVVICTLGARKGKEASGSDFRSYRQELIKMIDYNQNQLTELIIQAQIIQAALD